MHESSVPLLTADGLTHGYARSTVLRDVSISVASGEAVGIFGRSGSGKTTLLHILAGLFPPQAGSVTFDGVRLDDLPEKRRSHIRLRRFGFVFQFGELVPELTIGENVDLPLRLLGQTAKSSEKARDEVLERLGIGHLADELPSQVSGGEMQRAAVARAVVHRPQLVIGDEPTGALDASNRDAVIGLLKDATQHIDASLVIATHDNRISDWLDSCYELEAGQLKTLASI